LLINIAQHLHPDDIKEIRIIGEIHPETSLKVSFIGPDGDIKKTKFLKIG
jgi:hypothetical protein